MCGKEVAQSCTDADSSLANRPVGTERDGFPETQLDVLAWAAEGDWEPFLNRYLQPCWREVVLSCRMHGISLDDAEDVFQQVMLRMLQRGGFRGEIRRSLAAHGQPPDFRGNLAGRYLKFRELRLDGARFRTYLQGMIRNLVCEAVRAAARRPKQLNQEQWKAIEPVVEESISRSLRQSWLRQCLEDASWQLHRASNAARTKGRGRLFRILYLSTVLGRPAKDIAAEMAIDRTTVAGLLTEARGRFAAHLGQAADIDDPEELKGLLTEEPGQLTAALALVYDLSRTSRKG